MYDRNLAHYIVVTGIAIREGIPDCKEKREREGISRKVDCARREI